jgi:hypothetical protein
MSLGWQSKETPVACPLEGLVRSVSIARMLEGFSSNEYED